MFIAMKKLVDYTLTYKEGRRLHGVFMIMVAEAKVKHRQGRRAHFSL
jgi:hypothetical protein